MFDEPDNDRRLVLEMARFDVRDFTGIWRAVVRSQCQDVSDFLMKSREPGESACVCRYNEYRGHVAARKLQFMVFVAYAPSDPCAPFAFFEHWSPQRAGISLGLQVVLVVVFNQWPTVCRLEIFQLENLMRCSIGTCEKGCVVYRCVVVLSDAHFLLTMTIKIGRSWQ